MKAKIKRNIKILHIVRIIKKSYTYSILRKNVTSYFRPNSKNSTRSVLLSLPLISNDKILAHCELSSFRSRGAVSDGFAGPRRRRRRLDWNRVRRASNNARNYGAAVGHPDACRQCLANVPSHLPILSHFCAWTVRACMHREPIDPNFCPPDDNGRPCTLHRAEKEAWIWNHHFFPSFLEVGWVEDFDRKLSSSSLTFSTKGACFSCLEWNWNSRKFKEFTFTF